MKAVDLFAGWGGFTLGAEAAGVGFDQARKAKRFAQGTGNEDQKEAEGETMDQQTEELIERLTKENHRLYNENLAMKRENMRLKKLVPDMPSDDATIDAGDSLCA